MDYEEALKAVFSILDRNTSVEIWCDNFGWLPAKDKIARKLAEEIYNAFIFGTKW